MIELEYIDHTTQIENEKRMIYVNSRLQSLKVSVVFTTDF